MLAARFALPLLLVSTWAVTRASADTAFLPTYAEARARAAGATSERLERLLLALPEVVKARVHLTVIDDSRLPLDMPRPGPRLSAWLLLRGAGPSDTEVMALLSSAAPDLEPSDIRVVRQSVVTEAARPSEPPLTDVGPFRVAAQSAPGLRGLLGALLTLIVLLSALILSRRPRLKA